MNRGPTRFRVSFVSFKECAYAEGRDEWGCQYFKVKAMLRIAFISFAFFFLPPRPLQPILFYLQTLCPFKVLVNPDHQYFPTLPCQIFI